MREIIFRGKRIDNGDWVTGYLMDENYINVPFNDDSACGRFDEPIEIDPETVCQYTGVRDTNGNMIFENDILEREIFGNKIIGFVVWRNIGMTGLFLKAENKSYFIGKGRYDDDENEECNDLILGNVFDNPELLEEA